jgi:hypothetical protein
MAIQINIETNDASVRQLLAALNDTNQSLSEAQKRVDQLESQIGNGLKKGTDKAKTNLQGVSNGVSGLDKAFNGLDRSIGTNLGLFGDLGDVAQGLGSAFPTLTGGIKALKVQFIQMGAALLANPIFLISAAIVAIVAAVGLVLNAFGLLQPVLDGIGNVVNGLIAGFRSLTDWLGLTTEASGYVAGSFTKMNEASKEYKASLVLLNEESARNIKLLEAQGASSAEIAVEQQKIIANNLIIIAQDKELANAIGDVATKFGFEKLANQAKERTIELTKQEKDAIVESKVVELNAIKETAAEGQAAYDKYKTRIADGLKALEESEKAKVVKTVEGSTERLAAEIAALKATEEYQLLNFKALEITEAGKTILIADNIDKRLALEKGFTDKQDAQAKKEAADAKAKRDFAIESTKLAIERLNTEIVAAKDNSDKLIELELKKGLSKKALLEEQLANELASTTGGEEAKKQIREKYAILQIQREQETAGVVANIQKTQADLVLKNKADKDKLDADTKALKEKTDKEELDRKKEIQALVFKTAGETLAAFQAVSDSIFEISNAARERRNTDELKGLEEGSAAYVTAKNKQIAIENEYAKKQFAINKALQISGAVMSGLQGILAITTVPDFTLGVQTALRIGAQVALSAATVAKIAGTQFKGTATLSAPSGAGAIPSAGGAGATPNLNLFGNANTGNVQAATANTSVTGPGGQMRVIATVSETEISAVQRRNRRYAENSEL